MLGLLLGLIEGVSTVLEAGGSSAVGGFVAPHNVDHVFLAFNLPVTLDLVRGSGLNAAVLTTLS